VQYSVRREFSKRFREALNQAGHKETQLNELGEFFNVSGQAVRKWLDGDAIPSSTRAPKIATMLGVRRAWLLDGELPMRSIQLEVKEKTASYKKGGSEGLSISAEEYQLLSNYRKLPRQLQKAVDTLLSNIDSGS
jgi:phage repressor protein C with HTH and peptisase S24 domain